MMQNRVVEVDSHKEYEKGYLVKYEKYKQWLEGPYFTISMFIYSITFIPLIVMFILRRKNKEIALNDNILWQRFRDLFWLMLCLGPALSIPLSMIAFPKIGFSKAHSIGLGILCASLAIIFISLSSILHQYYHKQHIENKKGLAISLVRVMASPIFVLNQLLVMFVLLVQKSVFIVLYILFWCIRFIANTPDFVFNMHPLTRKSGTNVEYTLKEYVKYVVYQSFFGANFEFLLSRVSAEAKEQGKVINGEAKRNVYVFTLGLRMFASSLIWGAALTYPSYMFFSSVVNLNLDFSATMGASFAIATGVFFAFYIVSLVINFVFEKFQSYKEKREFEEENGLRRTQNLCGLNPLFPVFLVINTVFSFFSVLHYRGYELQTSLIETPLEQTSLIETSLEQTEQSSQVAW